LQRFDHRLLGKGQYIASKTSAAAATAAIVVQSERREVWEICEDRYQTRSTILASQLPVSRWHEQIGDPTIADGILDRLVHNAHRIEMRGESMRKKRNPPQDEKKE
jgi:DNA replication protein DnaC